MLTKESRLFHLFRQKKLVTMMSRVILFTVSLALLSTGIHAADPCRFEYPAKGVIDLSSLAKTDGSAAFPDQPSGAGSSYKYSYNPCRPFTEGKECNNVAMCQVSGDLTLRFALGTQESAVWSQGAGLGSSPSVSYSLGLKQVTVNLVCSDSTQANFEVLGESPINNYKFRLTHKCACWDGCASGPQPTTKKPSGGGGGGVGGGTVFIIILIVLVFVYLVGFAAFYRFRQQRSGLELIPHRTFWVALPGYARDGAVYIYRRTTGKGETNYQSV